MAGLRTKSSWEGWIRPFDFPAPDCESDGAASDDDMLTAEEASSELVSMLVDLKVRGAISAKSACILAYWATQAGAQGAVTGLAAKPGQSVGNYSRRFDTFTGLGVHQAVDFYELPCGRRLRATRERRYDPLPLRLPHEALLEELLVDDSVVSATREAITKGEMPPLYWDDPVVQGAGPDETVLAYSLYVDGVDFTRSDNIIAFTIYFLFSQRRHVCFAYRKSEACNCGCRGWCTLEPVFAAIAWSAAALRTGRHPNSRHDGGTWWQSDRARASYAGEQMPYKAILLFVKGDWAELVQRFGLPSWSDHNHPCPYCHVTLADFYAHADFSWHGVGQREKTLQDYLEACSACEIRLMLSARQIRAVRAALKYDKILRGRVLRHAFPHLGLDAGDRLAPTLQFPDIADFSPEQAPREVLFWRPSRATLARHRNPLLSEQTGVTFRSLGVDWLHCLSMGVFAHALGHLLRELVDNNAWGVSAGAAQREELSVVQLRADLYDWYRREVAAGKRPSKVQSLTLHKLGPSDNPFLGIRGGECNGMLRFANSWLLDAHGWCLGKRLEHYRTCIGNLVEILDICRRNARAIGDADIQLYCSSLTRCLNALHALGISERPKHHQAMELGARLPPSPFPAQSPKPKETMQPYTEMVPQLFEHNLFYTQRLVSR